MDEDRLTDLQARAMNLGQGIHPPLVILGPTASGKTRLAVALARKLQGAILSADSRQVYRGLDIGTGKDLEEYGDTPYYLIDLLPAGAQYDISQYLKHAASALEEVRSKGLRPIICGGTGMYIQALLQGVDYSEVPVNQTLRSELDHHTLEELQAKLATAIIPNGFRPDSSTKKRLIRALEICAWCRGNPEYRPATPLLPEAIVFGLDPGREERRQRISERLQLRLSAGLLEEVQDLLDQGLSPEQLIYYGLEYKYCTLYLQGQLDRSTFESRLETEIHRFAKRQMTYFRKMEKNGIAIHWLKSQQPEAQLTALLQQLDQVTF